MGRALRVTGVLVVLGASVVIGVMLVNEGGEGGDGGNPDSVFTSAGISGDGTLFLLMADRGAVVRATATSASVDARVGLGDVGEDLELVQHGDRALVADRDNDQVLSVSPAGLDVLEGPALPDRAQLVAGGGRAYLVARDGTIVALSADGRTTTDELRLSSTLGRAAVDDDGTLWVVDRGSGELLEVADGELRRRQPVGSRDPGLAVGLSGRGGFVVDPASGTLVGPDGTAHSLGREEEGVLLPARSADAGSVAWTVARADGTLLGMDLANGRVLGPVDVGAPGDRFVAPIVTGGTVYVANLSRGSVFLVDAASGGTPLYEISIEPGGGTFALRTADGYVVFDNESGPRAGVIDVDGDVRRLNKNDEGAATPPPTTAPPTTTTTTTTVPPPPPDGSGGVDSGGSSGGSGDGFTGGGGTPPPPPPTTRPPVRPPPPGCNQGLDC